MSGFTVRTMPQPAEEHAWRDFRTPSARLAALPEPQPVGPVYEQIGRVLATAVETRVFKQAERLPTSAAIAARFDVAPDTARAALRWLISQGYAERQPGGATYARGPKRPF